MADHKDNAIYLEADEDITSAIDKLVKSADDTVQVVAAKRSTLIQSKTNLRLLKKSADDAGKKLVLVTTDRVATNLASRIGLPVASQVGETPRVPTGPAEVPADDEVMAEEVQTPEPPVAPESAAAAAAEPDPEPKPAITRTPVAPVAKPAKETKEKRIPNFNRLQKRALWIGGGLLALLLLLVLNWYITSAKVTLFAKADQVPTSFDFTADPSASDVNTESAVIPANQITIQKNLTGVVQATGKKDAGTPAHGTMTISNCYDNQAHTFVAGTRFQSPDGKIFRSDEDATVPAGAGSFFGCTTPGKVSVSVTADANGDNYNLASGTKYTLPGLSAAQQAGIVGTGGQMSGGTSKTIQIVQQADVDKAKDAALAAAKNSIQSEFNSKAGKNQLAISASLQENDGTVSSNPAVGAEASSATLTIQVTYTELAVDRGKLAQLTKAQEQKQVGNENQIYDDGVANMKITAGKAEDGGGAQRMHAETNAYAGGKIDKTALAKQLKGKKYGEAADLASHLDGVERAEVAISPSWTTSMPGITSHIHIDIRVSNNSSNQ